MCELCIGRCHLWWYLRRRWYPLGCIDLHMFKSTDRGKNLLLLQMNALCEMKRS
jgi:hypothetical protein